MNTNPWSTSRISDESVWCCSMIHFTLHLVQIPHLAPHNRAFYMLYSWCDTGGCSSFTNSSPHIDPPIWLKDFEHGFVSPKDFILLLYSPVFVGLGSLKIFDIVFTHFFSRHWFSCAMIFEAVGLLSCKLGTEEMVLYSCCFGLPALLLALLCPISWCLLTV